MAAIHVSYESETGIYLHKSRVRNRQRHLCKPLESRQNTGTLKHQPSPRFWLASCRAREISMTQQNS